MSEKITLQNIASLQFMLTWNSPRARHHDALFARKVNFGRDPFPENLIDRLVGSTAGEQFSILYGEMSLVSPFSPDNEFAIDQRQFDWPFAYPGLIGPRLGRFYPKGILKGIPNVLKSNMEPFRCTGLDDKQVMVDFNHPMSRQEAALEIRIANVQKKLCEIGSCTAWLEVAAAGPGMQVRYGGMPTDFFSGDPFRREDETVDSLFYSTPRLVSHVDERAISIISGIYGQHLTSGMDVLDLMSSWQSHIPKDIILHQLVGIGLNEAELRNNSQLTDYLIHDLNTEPLLPFATNKFDAVICTVSVEYLIHPFNVFEEIARVLRPKGVCIVTFSNRWFPPKAIRIWSEIHEFERMGLVIEYFLQSGKFNGIETYSMRGLPRPEDDRYFPNLLTADPVYAVWGKKVAD